MATKASRIALAGSNISSTGEVDADLLDNIDSAAFLSLDSNGRLGIGTSSPMSQLHVNKNVSGHNTDGITLGKVENAGWIDVNEEMGRLSWSASYGSSYTPGIGAYISAKADANWDGTETPTRLGFFTAPEGSTTPVERVRIDSSGAVNFKSTGVVTLKAAPIGSTYGAGFNVMTVTGTGNAPYTSTIGFSNYSKTNAMVIQGDKVGIGTSNPDSLLHLQKTRGTISGGSSDTGAVLKLHTEAQWESGYGNNSAASTNDYLGSIEFSTGDGSTGEGVRAAIRGTVDSYYNQNSLVFETCDQGDTTLDERMRILHSGNVGIGTQEPIDKLNVHYGSTETYNTTLTKGTNTQGLWVTNSTNDDNMAGIHLATGGGTHFSSIVGARTNNASHWGTHLAFYTHNHTVANINTATEKMRIAGNGNVHLNSGLDVRIQLGTSGTGANSVSDNSVYVRGNDDDLILGAAGNGNIFFKENADTRMTIKTGGNVGIGTTNPGNLLTVYNSSTAGNTKVHIHNDKNGDAAELRLEGKRTSNNDTGQLLYVNSGNVVSRISANSSADDGDLRFFTSSSGTGSVVTERMRIDSSGKMSYPSQTRFSAFGTGGSTSYSASSPFVMQVVRNNVNGRYNTSNGIFTADVDGYYQFRFNAYTYNSGQWSVLYWNGSSISSFVDTNGTTAGGDHTVLCSVNTNQVHHMAWTMHLASGTGCAVGWRSGYSGSIYRSHAQFSGELISAD